MAIRYASPTGSAANSGAIDSPWTFAHACSAGILAAGDTLYLRGGTYVGPFTSDITGSVGNYVTVRAYNKERVIFDGPAPLVIPPSLATQWTLQLTADGVGAFIYHKTGSYVEYRDLEFMWSYDQRPPCMSFNSRYRYAGFVIRDVEEVSNVGIRLINCVFHDLGTALELYTSAEDTLVYGCLFYNNGYDDPAFRGCSGGCQDGTGHDIYVQNLTPSTKIFRDCICCNGYGVGYHGYADNAKVDNLSFVGCVAINKGINNIKGNIRASFSVFISGDAVKALVLDKCYSYHPLNKAGGAGIQAYGQSINENLAMTDCVFVGSKNLAIVPKYNTTISLQRNRFFGALPNGTPDILTGTGTNKQRHIRAGTFPGGGTFVDNQYFNYSYTTEAFEYEGSGRHNSYPLWQTQTAPVGGESGSMFITTPPTGKWIYVRQNEYESKRAMIVIYNFDQHATVMVDVNSLAGATVLADGDSYIIRNAQNIFGPPVKEGTYRTASPSIEIPVEGLAAAPLIGQPWDVDHEETPKTKQFNVFIIEAVQGIAYEGCIRTASGLGPFESTVTTFPYISAYNFLHPMTVEARIHYKELAPGAINNNAFTRVKDGIQIIGIMSVARFTRNAVFYSNGITPGGTLISTTILQDDRFYHIAATVDTTEAKLYVDGVLEVTKTVEAPFPGFDSGDINIIAVGEAELDVSELRYWNVVRTQSEIMTYMSPGSLPSPYPATLKGLWNFNEQSGLMILDYSGNNNHGTKNANATFISEATALGS